MTNNPLKWATCHPQIVLQDISDDAHPSPSLHHHHHHHQAPMIFHGEEKCYIFKLRSTHLSRLL